MAFNHSVTPGGKVMWFAAALLGATSIAAVRWSSTRGADAGHSEPFRPCRFRVGEVYAGQLEIEVRSALAPPRAGPPSEEDGTAPADVAAPRRERTAFRGDVFWWVRGEGRIEVAWVGPSVAGRGAITYAFEATEDCETLRYRWHDLSAEEARALTPLVQWLHGGLDLSAVSEAGFTRKAPAPREVLGVASVAGTRFEARWIIDPAEPRVDEPSEGWRVRRRRLQPVEDERDASGLAAQVVESDGEMRLFADGGRVVSLRATGREQDRLVASPSAPPLMAVAADYGLSLHRLDAERAGEVIASGVFGGADSSGGWRRLADGSTAFDASPTDPRGDTAARSWTPEEAWRASERWMAERQPVLAARVLADAAVDHPELIEALRERLVRGPADEWSSVLLFALERAATPQAEAVLSELAFDPSHPIELRSGALIALGGLTNPAPTTVAALRAMARDEGGPLQSTSRLALGLLAESVDEARPELRGQLLDDLASFIDAARSNDAQADLSVAVAAAGNAGPGSAAPEFERRLVEAVERSVEATPIVREAAARTLGRLQTDDVSPALLRLAGDASADVRTQAWASLRQSIHATEGAAAVELARQLLDHPPALGGVSAWAELVDVAGSALGRARGAAGSDQLRARLLEIVRAAPHPVVLKAAGRHFTAAELRARLGAAPAN